MLSKMNLTIVDMSRRLDKLDNVEKKVEKFDFELKKIWLHINDTAKVTQKRVDRLDDRISSAEIDLENARARMNDLEREKDSELH
jgi:predicted  nucleic acid-binding Zn-ribbon protein